MAKKFNLKKTVRKATKSVQKAAAPIAKPIARAAAPITKSIARAAAPITKSIARAAAPITAPAIASITGNAKQKLNECNKVSAMKTTEITNLKFQLDAANNDKINLLGQIKTKDNTITTLNQNIDSLNRDVSTLTNRINAPLVRSEGFTGISSENQVTRNDPYVVYDLRKSGLAAAANEYQSLYGKYFQGYQDNETMIQDELIPKVEYLATTDLNGLMYSYTAVKQQNKTLESQIEETGDEYSTDFQKTKYLNEDLEYTKKINAIMFFSFYILFFVLAYAIFENTSFELTLKIKSVILFILFLYPYWIGYLWRGGMFLINYLGSLFQGTPYESSV